MTEFTQPSETVSDVERLLSDYTKESRKRERQARRLIFAGVVIAGTSWLIRLIALIGGIYGWWDRMPYATKLFITSFQFFLIITIICAGIVLWRVNPYAEALTQLNDKRAISPLIHAIQGFGTSVPRPFFYALMRLLPQLKASDAPLLSSQEKATLYASILPASSLQYDAKSADRHKYQLIALAAIEQIGDFKALPMLEKLDHSGILSPYIDEAIVRCKMAVEERAERDKLSQTLLRASANQTDNATLLKPAQSGSADETALLRPIL